MKIKAVFYTFMLLSLTMPYVNACEPLAPEPQPRKSVTTNTMLFLLPNAFTATCKRITALQLLDFVNPDHLLLISQAKGLNQYIIANIQHSAVDPDGGFKSKDKSENTGEVILSFPQWKVRRAMKEIIQSGDADVFNLSFLLDPSPSIVIFTKATDSAFYQGTVDYKLTIGLKKLTQAKVRFKEGSKE